MTNTAAPIKNQLVQGLTMDAKVRYLLVEFTAVLNEAIRKHGLNKGSTRYLADAMAAALLLSSQIKGDERLSLQLESSSPQCRIICDINAEGGIRAKITPNRLPSDVEHPTLDGFLVTIKHNQQRNCTAYNEIRHETIASAIEHHLNQSSQLDCKVRIETAFDKLGNPIQAYGLLLEKYPISHDNLRQPERNLKVHTAHLLRCPVNSLYLVKNIRSVHLTCWTESKPISWFCGCSEERIDTMLGSIGPEELTSMIEELELLKSYVILLNQIHP